MSCNCNCGVFRSGGLTRCVVWFRNLHAEEAALQLQLGYDVPADGVEQLFAHVAGRHLGGDPGAGRRVELAEENAADRTSAGVWRRWRLGGAGGNRLLRICGRGSGAALRCGTFGGSNRHVASATDGPRRWWRCGRESNVYESGVRFLGGFFDDRHDAVPSPQYGGGGEWIGALLLLVVLLLMQLQQMLALLLGRR